MNRLRAAPVAQWLRNVLLAAGLAFVVIGSLSIGQLRLQSETGLPTPVAIEDPNAAPVFSEEDTSDTSNGDCAACHLDKLGRIALNPDDQSSPVTTTSTLVALETPTPRPRATPTAIPIIVPAPPTQLTIANLNIDSPVVAVGSVVRNGQTIWEVPRDVVGWNRATAMAGAKGNMVMSGHVSQQVGLGVFRDLSQIHIGDPIEVATASQRFTYVVQDVRTVLPTETSYLRPTSNATLTLITCAGHFDLLTRTYSHRLVVIAVLQ